LFLGLAPHSHAIFPLDIKSKLINFFLFISKNKKLQLANEKWKMKNEIDFVCQPHPSKEIENRFCWAKNFSFGQGIAFIMIAVEMMLRKV